MRVPWALVKYNNDHKRIPWCSEGLENVFFRNGKNSLAESRKSQGPFNGPCRAQWRTMAGHGIKYSIINWPLYLLGCFEEIFGLMTNDILEFSCENEDFLWQERRDKICTIGAYSMNCNTEDLRIGCWDIAKIVSCSRDAERIFSKISQRIWYSRDINK